MANTDTPKLPDDPMKWTDQQVIDMLQDRENPLSKARAKFYHNAAKLEQADEQQKPPGPIKRRRMEFQAAIEILQAYGVTL